MEISYNSAYLFFISGLGTWNFKAISEQEFIVLCQRTTIHLNAILKLQ